VESAKYCDGDDVSSIPRSSDDWDREPLGGELFPEFVLPLDSSFRLLCLCLACLKISIGKSAIPIVRLAMVPSNAEAPPEIGSHGPSSVSYSRGR
jgi:hypothetical protein